jgi:hypothetical protein
MGRLTGSATDAEVLSERGELSGAEVDALLARPSRSLRCR